MDSAVLLNTFLATISALSSLAQVLMAQEQRLERYKDKFPELRSTQPRKDLPSDYLNLVDILNAEAQTASEQAVKSPELTLEKIPELAGITRAIPPAILEAMRNNVQRCWDRLQHFISENHYTPEERQRAHVFARQCICNELSEMINYLGELPADLQQYWNACGCPTPITLLNRG